MAETTTPPIVNLGSARAIPIGQGRCYLVGTEEVAVFRQRDGRIFATQNRCPHRQGPLADGLVGSNKVICPLHSHQFNLATGAGSEPIECVQVYSVHEVNGDLLLNLEGTAISWNWGKGALAADGADDADGTVPTRHLS
jgi:nitrite reductase (NADH) small subunit